MPVDHPEAETLLAGQLGLDDLDCALFFASPGAANERLRQAAGPFRALRSLGGIGNGEIDVDGYARGRLMGIGLPRSHFRARAIALTEAEAQETTTLVAQILAARGALQREVPQWSDDFAILMVDGQHLAEEQVVARIASALGPVPLIGGTVRCPRADAPAPPPQLPPRSDALFCGTGHGRGAAAMVVIVRGRCPVRAFRSDHFAPRDRRMVVTAADPARRLVHALNGAPAAAEYARLTGLDPSRLTQADFVDNPLLARMGEEHFVRSIHRVTPDGGLEFLSAVAEGMVLTLAAAGDMAAALDRDLTALATAGPVPGAPDAILAFDSHLRRVEAGTRGQIDEVSRILMRHRVRGLSSFTEQQGGRHLNHSLAGLAIYPPCPEAPARPQEAPAP